MNEKMTDENMEKKANSNLQNNEEAVDLNQDTNKDEANEPPKKTTLRKKKKLHNNWKSWKISILELWLNSTTLSVAH